MKRYIILILCICLLAIASAASAQNPEGYKVTYIGNNCLASVPTDERVYQAGEYVTVMFDPVTYMNGLIFYGWDWNNDGVADFGYAYNNFNMPARDVEMKAICITPYSGPQAPAAPCGGYWGCWTPAPQTPGNTPGHHHHHHQGSGTSTGTSTGWGYGWNGWGYGWGWGYSSYPSHFYNPVAWW
ncbi:MAG: hypothetical protein IKP86_14030 [Anaerolineaceae bacterium]|nr:hypothetical protein [Anaerolineaceae bacterium]